MASSSEVENISLYISTLEEKITNSTSDPEYVKDYRRAQLYQLQGLFADSLTCLERAMTDVRPFKYDFIWEGTFLSIGSLFASNLNYFDKLDEAEDVYSELLRSHPDGDFLCDYALFLHKRRRDFNKAEIVFQRALNLFPGHSSLHLKYAGFLRHAKRDTVGADKHYELAALANPKNADAIGCYASFLHGVIGNMDGASQYYEEAVKVDPTHSNNLCNYGLFLSEVKLQYELAETHYSNALKYSPLHVNALYNYGVMLDTHCKRKTEAEALYRRAIAGEPKHPFALYNLAVLLEERLTVLSPNKIIKKAVRFSSSAATAVAMANSTSTIASLATTTSSVNSLGEEYGEDAKGTIVTVDEVQLRKQITVLTNEVRSMYERAVDADPIDAASIADFGRFLWTRTDDVDAAEEVLRKTLRLDDKSEVALYNLGALLFRHKCDFVNAESTLHQLLSVNPLHSSGWHLLAKLFIKLAKNRSEHSVPNTPGKGGGSSLESTNKSIKTQPSYISAKVQSAGTPSKSIYRQIGTSKKILSSRVLLEKAMDCYEKAMDLLKDPGSIMVEYLNIISVMGDPREKVRALSTAGMAMKQIKQKGRKMSNESNIKVALDTLAKNESF